MESHKKARAQSAQGEVYSGNQIIGPYYKDENNVLHLDYNKLMPNIGFLVKLTITCLLSSM